MARLAQPSAVNYARIGVEVCDKRTNPWQQPMGDTFPVGEKLNPPAVEVGGSTGVCERHHPTMRNAG